MSRGGGVGVMTPSVGGSRVPSVAAGVGTSEATSDAEDGTGVGKGSMGGVGRGERLLLLPRPSFLLGRPLPLLRWQAHQ